MLEAAWTALRGQQFAHATPLFDASAPFALVCVGLETQTTDRAHPTGHLKAAAEDAAKEQVARMVVLVLVEMGRGGGGRQHRETRLSRNM